MVNYANNGLIELVEYLMRCLSDVALRPKSEGVEL